VGQNNAFGFRQFTGQPAADESAADRSRRPAQPQAAHHQRGETMLNKIASGLAALAESPISLTLQAIANDWRQMLVRVTFGIFVGGLITLLILLYSGIAIV
jgi:hypothetical protein